MTANEFLITCGATTISLLIIFYSLLLLWVINRFKTSEELKEWCLAWRDKPDIGTVIYDKIVQAWYFCLLFIAIKFEKEE